ncbi:MAG: ComF family protein, partial [Kovacikia sp.]
LGGWLSLVLEGCCPLCQRSTPQEFCLDCRRQIQRCQLHNTDQGQSGQPAVFAWGSYTGSLKRTIAAFKYENQPHLARPLGHWMAQSWLESHQHSTNLVVVPIPLHPSKQKQRGFNQADLLAQYFCELSGLPLETQGLERSQETIAQFKLSATEREENLAQAFRIGKAFLKKMPDHPVLLLDDIYTTGATVKSATHTLRRRGIRVCGVVVLARTCPEITTRDREKDRG